MIRYITIVAAIVACVVLFATCMDGSGEERYAGSVACNKCHGQLYDGFHHTAHAFASMPAAGAFIKGSFQRDSNSFSFNDYSSLPVDVRVVMEKRDSGFYQTAWIKGSPRRSERFGVVIGAGRKAQSYLYWRGNQLLQLPISWFAATHSWANSPGFPTAQIKFNRLIPAHCLECHATTAALFPTTETIPGPDPPAYFDRAKLIYGIGCENCHGPGARHIAFHEQHPGDTTAAYIVNPARLSRQQRLDICAACHSGIRQALQPAFSFRAGDTLTNYFGPSPVVDTGHIEVHGNQYGLLAASKCFRQSSLECGSCHNPHGSDDTSLAVFSQRCMNCHAPASAHDAGRVFPAPYCKRIPAKGEDIRTNCIDCHMPVKASGLVNLMVPGRKQLAPLLVRTHRIAVYPMSRFER